jgi:hypothetical protein
MPSVRFSPGFREVVRSQQEGGNLDVRVHWEWRHTGDGDTSRADHDYGDMVIKEFN